VPDLATGALYMERTEVTNAAFKRFVDAKGYERLELWDEAARPLIATFRDGCPGGTCSHRGPRSWTDGGFGDQANAERPVRGVTVHEARAFARWRSLEAKAHLRLPTDPEWQVAAGWDPATGRLRAFPWGDEWLPGALALGADLPRPVGTTPGDASALGLADAGGNVVEWVERVNGSPGTKGASFACDEEAARHFALVRNTGSPGARPPQELLVWIGFRLVREVEDK
jgi:iron(II)-dependent oxidoreductase